VGLDSPNDSEDDWETDIDSEINVDNGIIDSETQEKRNLSAVLNVLGLIRPTRMLVLAMVPYLEPASFIGLCGNGLTTSQIGDFLCQLPN
jgi:hypothetical protein